MLLQIGTLLGAGTDGAFDRMMDGAPTTDAATLLAEVTGVDQAHGRPDTLRPRDGCNGPGGLCVATDTDLSHLAGSTVRPGTADEGRPLDEQVITIRLPFDEIDEPTGRGFFDQRQVTEAVRRRLGAIRRCYEHTLGARGEVSGKVTTEFTIQEAGNVTSVRTVENTTGTPRMAECVERSVRTLRFDPGPEGGSVTFRYPFVFAEQR
jgi:TonB family protein